jgi:hypothetical protein
MSGPFGSSQWMYSSGGFYPYEIEQSLRFNDNDSAYLSRTPSVTSNQKKWTFSAWVKRGNLGTTQSIFSGNSYSGNDGIAAIYFQGDQLYTYYDTSGTNPSGAIGPALYRDPSAWYHIVWAVDAVNTEHKIWVNNELVSTDASKYPPDFAYGVNRNGTSMGIGANIWTPVDYFDGYMAEVNFVDGEYLTPTSFGEFKSDIWVPKAYTGSYGTNGFYLTFEDGAAIGDDLSGNTNDWTANNLVSTDVLLDSPTNNFAVLNPLALGADGTLSDGNLKITYGSSATRTTTTATMGASSGKWYWEVTANINGSEIVGVTNEPDHSGIYPGSTTGGWGYYSDDGSKYLEGTNSSYGASWITGDVIGFALDMDAGTLVAYKNGVSQGTMVSGLTGTIFPAIGDGSGVNTTDNTFNFGQSAFTYTPPSGFLALCTANLPDPVIDPAQDDVPADYFNTVLYTGTGAALSVTGVGFQPDWTWIKGRSGATDHGLYDAVRGVQEQLESNQTGAETTEATGLTAFGADGFSVGALAQLNTSSATYVAWNWLAGNGTSSNTDGSITSTVSVNQKAGFSIVSYTGTGANATVGHGLGAAPKMVIVKNRDQADAWQVYHGANTANPETDYLVLNTTAATADAADRWNDTLPTSSVFSIGSGAEVNTSAEDYIAYCFAEVEGFSKFGSYTGNGSADGPFVYCGFRPAFVMIKRSDSTSNWTILDDVREGYNVDNDPLYPNLSNAEGTADLADLLSNGFKLRSTDASVNANNGTYIFAAFAEQPVKYSNAR